MYYEIEGAGVDRIVSAETSEKAALIVAKAQWGQDGAELRTTWRDSGSDGTTIATYGVERGPRAQAWTLGRITVRRVTGALLPLRVLHAAGIETCQSCEGGPGRAYPEPTIDLPRDDGLGLRAVAALEAYGLKVSSIARVWNLEHGMPIEVVWRVVLRRAHPERADERPIFIMGTVAQ